MCECSSYLPLSHIAAQLIDIHCLQALGGTTYFAQPDALKVRRVSLSYSTLTQPNPPFPTHSQGSLTTTLREVRPTIFFGVPRVWEKIQVRLT